MKYDWILIGLYLLVLIVIVRDLFSMMALTVVIVLLMVIVIVQKIGLEKMINSGEEERNRKLDDMRAKIEGISNKTDGYRDDFNRQIVFVDNKVSEVRHFVEVEISNAYNDLSRRLVGIEERLNEVRQLFSAAVGSLDERVESVEKKEDEIF
jgi:predicted  nucleic acid-binding Zn-ribbon protein